MSKWIDFSIAERKAMIQRVVNSRNIDEVSAEKDWWVTAVLYALFHMSSANYLLFKGGTSLSKGWDIINRFSEDIDLALDRNFFLKERNEKCANCASNTQIHHLREKGQDYFVAHREKFYHVGYVDYSKEMPSEITILPPNALRSEYKADYKDMQKSFIYADSLDFETLMGEINKLQTRFRSIQL